MTRVSYDALHKPGAAVEKIAVIKRFCTGTRKLRARRKCGAHPPRVCVLGPPRYGVRVTPWSLRRQRISRLPNASSWGILAALVSRFFAPDLGATPSILGWRAFDAGQAARASPARKFRVRCLQRGVRQVGGVPVMPRTGALLLIAAGLMLGVCDYLVPASDTSTELAEITRISAAPDRDYRGDGVIRTFAPASPAFSEVIPDDGRANGRRLAAEARHVDDGRHRLARRCVRRSNHHVLPIRKPAPSSRATSSMGCSAQVAIKARSRAVGTRRPGAPWLTSWTAPTPCCRSRSPITFCLPWCRTIRTLPARPNARPDKSCRMAAAAFRVPSSRKPRKDRNGLRSVGWRKRVLPRMVRKPRRRKPRCFHG